MSVRDMDINDIKVKKVELVLNRGILLSMLFVIGLSIILTGFLAYIFSNSIFTLLCSLIIGTTVGFIINYFIITSDNLVKKVSIELSKEEDETETYSTVMQMD